MPSVDFAAWVTPDLDVTLAGHAYSCPPPSVASARVIVALAAISEVRMGLTLTPVDPEIQAIGDAQKIPLSDITLGVDLASAMEADGIDRDTIDRVGFYALHYWSRGKAMADAIATLLWDITKVGVTDTAPKVPSPTPSGPPTE